MMSSEEASSTARSTCTEISLFEEDWAKCGGGSPFEDLELISDSNTGQGHISDTYVDPQLLSTTSTSATTPVTLFSDTYGGEIDRFMTSGTEQDPMTLVAKNAEVNSRAHSQIGTNSVVGAHSGPDVGWNPSEQASFISLGDLPSYEPPPAVHQQVMAPYLHPPIQAPDNVVIPEPQQTYTPSLHPSYLRCRSFSEPPGGPSPDNFCYDQYIGPPSSQGQMILSHPGHAIGTPESPPNNISQPMRLKPRMPSKRYHPYSDNLRGGKQALGYEQTLKHAEPQPLRAPTSVPLSSQPMMMMDHHSPIIEPHQAPNLPMSPLQLVSSRICTPAPSPQRVSSPLPRPLPLRRPLDSANNLTDGTAETEGFISIPITVEQLRDMITEAVQKALKGAEKEATGVNESEPRADQDERQ